MPLSHDNGIKLIMYQMLKVKHFSTPTIPLQVLVTNYKLGYNSQMQEKEVTRIIMNRHYII